MQKSKVTRRRTASEWQKIVADWRASGEKAADFAEGKDFLESTLSWWGWKLGTCGGPEPEPLKFVPLVVEVDDAVGSHAAKEMGSEAEFGAGVVVGTTRWEIQTEEGLVVTMSGPEAVGGLIAALDALGRGRREEE